MTSLKTLANLSSGWEECLATEFVVKGDTIRHLSYAVGELWIQSQVLSHLAAVQSRTMLSSNFAVMVWFSQSQVLNHLAVIKSRMMLNSRCVVMVSSTQGRAWDQHAVEQSRTIPPSKNVAMEEYVEEWWNNVKTGRLKRLII